MQKELALALGMVTRTCCRMPPPLAGGEDVTSIGLLAKATLDNTAAEGKE
ncbi:MAG: hypothetical protein ACE5WD_14260 [Candidatus Aminicenantia bacterium]